MNSLSSYLFYAFLPIITWIIITMPLWLSPFHPAVVAYFILAFDIYFLYKSIKTAYLATKSYQKILLFSKFPFSKKIEKNKELKYIRHFIVIPNYNEPIYKLESTIQAIVKNDYPIKTLYLVLAFEKREIDSIKKYEILQKKFRDYFTDILVTYHKLIPHEVAGKASNQTFATKTVDDYVEQHNFERKKVLITICDADSIFSPHYFSYLTYEFLKDRDRDYHFYWAPVFLYNNFWKLPFFIRIQATLSSVLRLAFLSEKNNLIQISTYSTNLWLLKEVRFWDVDIIPEDWHIYLQAFFKFGNKVKTLPLFSIVNGDAVYSGGIIKTFLNRYDQEKRWAWGVSDIGYSLKQLFKDPFNNTWSKIKKISFIAENHLLWPTSFFVLTISAAIPPLVNPMFKRTVLGLLLPRMAGFILTLSSLMLILYTYLDIKIRQKVNQKTPLSSVPFIFIQWYLLPIISFFLSSLPSLEAHSRLLLKKGMTYKVTEKV